MSNSTGNIYDLIADNQTAIANIGTSEYPTASLTLTRTASLAITTAGTAITWQAENRNFGFTWSGTTVTIPSAGYYAYTVQIALAALVTIQIRVTVNSVNQGSQYNAVPFSTGGGYTATATFMQYFNGGETLTIALTPSINTTLNQNAEFFAAQSPFLHIVQLTGAYD